MVENLMYQLLAATKTEGGDDLRIDLAHTDYKRELLIHRKLQTP
jgi:hypothetical protein